MYLGEAARRHMNQGPQWISWNFRKLSGVLEDGQVEGTLEKDQGSRNQSYFSLISEIRIVFVQNNVFILCAIPMFKNSVHFVLFCLDPGLHTSQAHSPHTQPHLWTCLVLYLSIFQDFFLCVCFFRLNTGSHIC